MIRFTSLLLCAILLLNVFSQSTVVLSFFLQQEKISTTVCENKSHPEMHCHGKCFLKKQMDKQERREQNNNSSAREKQEYVAADKEFLQPLFSSTSDFDFPQQHFLTSEVTAGVFHPPC